MKIVESLFDVCYLMIVVAFGVRLLLEKKKWCEVVRDHGDNAWCWRWVPFDSEDVFAF